MNYQQIYDKLIDRAKMRQLDGYKERHHVIPRCMGGLDVDENLVELTPEEHYVAHQLLVKIYPENDKLIYAAIMMIPSRPNNKLYGWLKRRWSIAMSATASKRVGEKNSQFGTIWITDEINEQKILKSKAIPNGWRKGRKKKIFVERPILTEEQKHENQSNAAKLRWQNTEYRQKLCKKMSKVKIGNRATFGMVWINDGMQNRMIKKETALPDGFFYGKATSISAETKNKISKSLIGKMIGKKNPVYGKIWITDEKFNRAVDPTADIPIGWRRGRKKLSEETKIKISKARSSLIKR